MRVPSGDQLGCSPGIVVSTVSSVPSAPITLMKPSGSLNAILVPSGDQLLPVWSMWLGGPKSCISVRAIRPEPSLAIVDSINAGPGTACVKASLVPSGDQAGANSFVSGVFVTLVA